MNTDRVGILANLTKCPKSLIAAVASPQVNASDTPQLACYDLCWSHMSHEITILLCWHQMTSMGPDANTL